jgi:hypothetical protein
MRYLSGFAGLVARSLRTARPCYRHEIWGQSQSSPVAHSLLLSLEFLMLLKRLEAKGRRPEARRRGHPHTRECPLRRGQTPIGASC